MEKVQKDGKDMEKQKTSEVSSLEEGNRPPPQGIVSFSESEWSIDDRYLKRKDIKQMGNKPKKRRMEKLEGWGLSKNVPGDIPEEEIAVQEADNIRDWLAEPSVTDTHSHQTDISNWLERDNRVDGEKDGMLQAGRKVKTEENNIPKEQTPKRRKTGKLSKKEIKKMKGCHKDIATLLVKKNDRIDDEDNEIFENDKHVVDLERELRLERVLRRANEWKTWHICKEIMVDILYEVVDMVDMVSKEHQSAVEVGSLGEGTRSGWKSSQGGTSLKAADLKEGRMER